MEEIWKDIDGYEGMYQVSNLGRVKSSIRLVNGRGIGLHKSGGRILKPIKFGKYLGVQLSVNGISKKYYVHRLVANGFIPNPNNLPEVNHLDLNKYNNMVDNLEWVDKSQNAIHAYSHGMNHKAGGTPSKKVKVMFDSIEKVFDSISDAASFIGISQSSVSRFCSGERKKPMFNKYKAEYYYD